MLDERRATKADMLTLDDIRQMALEPQGIPQWRRNFSTGIVRGLLQAARGLARHWLALLNIFNLTLITIALLDPMLNAAGWTDVGGWLYRLCGVICTQTHGHEITIAGQPSALCQRCLATYGIMALLGIIFIKIFRRVPRINFWVFAAFCLPLVVDGITQYLGWRESTAELRLATGALFGTGVIWYMYPSFERGFRLIARRLDAQLRMMRIAQLRKARRLAELIAAQRQELGLID